MNLKKGEQKIMKLFVKKVQELMDKYEINQKKLSTLSGISESSISRYLSGSIEPRMDVVINIAKVFNVPANYFLEENSSKALNVNAYKETISIVTRNKAKLNDKEKAEIIKVLFGN